jgi:hypothetical protein
VHESANQGLRAVCAVHADVGVEGAVADPPRVRLVQSESKLAFYGYFIFFFGINSMKEFFVFFKAIF